MDKGWADMRKDGMTEEEYNELRANKIEELERRIEKYSEFTGRISSIVSGESDIHLNELIVDVKNAAEEEFEDEDISEDLSMAIQKAELATQNVRKAWDELKSSLYDVMARSARERKALERALDDLYNT